MDVFELARIFPNLLLSLASGLVAISLLLLILVSPLFLFITNAIIVWLSRFKWTKWTGALFVRTDLLLDALEKLFATSLVTALAFAAHNAWVYGISIFIVATFITYPEFLLNLASIFRGSSKYFEFEIAKIQIRNQDQTNFLTQELDKLRTQNRGLYFLNIYKDIYGSQLLILDILSTDTSKSFGSALFKSIHARTTYKDTYSFDQYMAYLIKMNLVQYEPSDDTYKITRDGIGFLTYLTENNLPHAKPIY